MKIEEVELANDAVTQNLVQYQVSNAIDEEIVANDLNSIVEFREDEKAKILLNVTVKRIFDIIGALVGIILLLPITLIVAIINVIYEENGSLFYTQERIGKDGKMFKLYKFRTMVENADEKLAELLKENEDMRKEYKMFKKLRNDPRITKAGKFLRKTSLDEFPQFINVLKGEMSLVGPRPYLKREKEEMGEYYDYIVKCKPGITGLWQTSGRNDVTFNDRLILDYKYYHNNNLKWDAQLLQKTVLNVIKKEGAA